MVNGNPCLNPSVKKNNRRDRSDTGRSNKGRRNTAPNTKNEKQEDSTIEGRKTKRKHRWHGGRNGSSKWAVKKVKYPKMKYRPIKDIA